MQLRPIVFAACLALVGAVGVGRADEGSSPAAEGANAPPVADGAIAPPVADDAIAPPAADDAKTPSPAAAGEKSLDDQLFDSLDGETSLPPDDGPESKDLDQPGRSRLDEELLEGLGDGEDVGEEKDPLEDLTRRMRSVETRIRQSKSGEETQEMQQKIADDLAKLVDEMVKKACQCQKSGQGQGQKSGAAAKRMLVKQPASKQKSRGASQKESPARESSDEVRKDELDKIQTAEVLDRMKRVWGHLPERLREQMQENADEEFLPLYQQLIGDYFQTLIDESEPSE